MVIILSLLLILIAAETAFRLGYRKKNGRSYFVSLKFPWKDMHVVAHPFLSFAYKKNGGIDLNQRLPYDLHPNKYFSFKNPLRLNQYGHFGEDWPKEKKKGHFRIACLGNSTTANNVSDEIADYTYPDLLRQNLEAKFKEAGITLQPEVLNCGIGGWISVDIMINYILNILPLRPDLVVINHGFTDLHLHLTPGFAPDYTHGRKNLGESLWRIRLGHLFPKIPFLHFYEFLKDKFIGTGNTRNDVARFTRTGEMDSKNEYSNLEREAEILSVILILCKHHGIPCLMCSYPFYAYKEDALTRKIQEGVARENAMWKKLSEEFGGSFLDLDASIPKENDYFLDWVHFTPKGMKVIADLLGEKIVEDLKRAIPRVSPADGTAP